MEALALTFFIIISILFWKLSGYWLSQMAKSNSSKSPGKTRSVISIAILFILGASLYFFLAYQHICSIEYTVASLLISLSLFAISFRKSSEYKDIPKLSRLNSLMVAFTLCSVLNMGVVFFCRWIFPDVTTVSGKHGKYEVTTTRAWPFTDNFRPTDSYVFNNSGDTLYRVVVSYAFLGKEINNHYNITDTLPPHTTTEIPCPPNYVARSIFPVMLPTSGRFGNSRTRRSYIVTADTLNEFLTYDFACYGINKNIRVNSFNMTSNPIVWENQERINRLEQILDNISREYHRK